MLPVYEKPVIQGQCFILLLILTVIQSCDRHDASYFPLGRGLTWHYTIEQQSVEGTLRQKDIIRSAGKTRFQGKSYQVLRTVRGVEYWYRQSAHAIALQRILLPDGQALSVRKELAELIHFPVRAGLEWDDVLTTRTLKTHDRHANKVVENVNVRVRIASISDTVKVGAGKYRHCLRIESRGEKLLQKGNYAYQDTMTVTVTNIRWYAAGVGLVKEEHRESSNDLNYPQSGYLKTLDRFSTNRAKGLREML